MTLGSSGTQQALTGGLFLTTFLFLAAGCGSSGTHAALATDQDTTPTLIAAGAMADVEWSGTTYDIDQAITVTNLPQDAGQVRVWLWLPNEDAYQSLLDFKVSAPGVYEIGPASDGSDYAVYVELSGPFVEDPVIGVQAIARRAESAVKSDPALSGPITEEHRLAFSEHLRTDVPFMEVDDRIRTIAVEICGDERNVLREAKAIYDYVVGTVDHYSKKTVSASPCGSQSYCLNEGGGSCTDMHSLFIALCRAREIPARITFGSRLKPQNEGTTHDPGYRCWAEFFCPGYGWMTVDVAAGDTVDGRQEYYFGQLDDQRIAFIKGRNLNLSPRQSGEPINIITRAAYVEVDGKPHHAFDRRVTFHRVNPASVATKDQKTGNRS